MRERQSYDLPDLFGLYALKKLVAEEESSVRAVVVLVNVGNAQLEIEAIKNGAHSIHSRT
jgi:hypothetical protein